MTVRSETTFYSQHGEDALILAAFEDLSIGTFVEVGCIDGRRFSNTLALEERGWRGVCVEGHADYIRMIRANRPGSVVVHAAVGECDANEVTFYANARGALSTLDPSLEARWKRDYGEWFSGFTEQAVPMRRLSTILNDADVSEVDVLSIDVDGTDAAVLRGIDFARHRPALIVIEADDEAARAEIDSLLLPQSYSHGATVATNRFYFRDPARRDRIRGLAIEGFVTHTKHPMDEGGDSRIGFRIRV